MYIIQPQYKQFESFVRSIPAIFEQQGETIYKERNEIKVFDCNGIRLNVKRYRCPGALNRVIYTFFRKSKVERAYEYAIRLNEMGVSTPKPVAYILEKRGGLIELSYLITLQSALKRNFYEFGKGSLAGREDIIRNFAYFTASLHEKGIYHKDYSPGNILFDVKETGEIEFTIVDINRMKFGDVGVREGCANFARLWGKQPMFELIAENYAEARDADAGNCKKWVLEAREQFWKRRNHDFYEYE